MGISDVETGKGLGFSYPTRAGTHRNDAYYPEWSAEIEIALLVV